MTEEKEVYSSIFDAASRMEKKKSHKSPEPAKEAAAQEKKPLLTDDEIQVQFEECKRLHNILADRIEEMLGRKKLTLRSLREYFNTAQNFTTKEWSLIQRQKELVQEMLTKLVPHEEEKQGSQKGKHEEKAPKKMQVKSRWISMR